jgi:SAM-dependent methyltransferase
VNHSRTTSKKAQYGLDAPQVVFRLFLAGLACLALGGFSPRLGLRGWGLPFFCQGCVLLAMSGLMVWASRIGKLRLRDKILQGIPWRGDERVLDVGCGHGLMLLGAARRLTSGRAIGIDVWSQEDQRSNSADATLENARREGIAERIEVLNGDARKIPFDAASFDVVLSSFAIHNIYQPGQREQAIHEIARVLKPGGHLAIADIRHIPEYERVLRRLGWTEIERRGPNFLFVIPTRILHAVKP